MKTYFVATGCIALILLAGMLNACGSYTARISAPIPQDFKPLPQSMNDLPIYFYIPQYMERYPSKRGENYEITWEIYEGIKSGLVDNNMFKEAIFIAAPPVKGIFCLITLDRKPTSALRKAYALLSTITLATIPYYDDASGYSITYELYNNKEKKGQHQYEISETRFVWTIFGVDAAYRESHWEDDLTWVGLGKHRSELFKKTTMMFLLEAHRDGFF